MTEIPKLTALLGERLLALRLLSQEIAAGQEACVALNHEKLLGHDRQKQALCAEVSRLDAQIAGLLREAAPGVSLRDFVSQSTASAGPEQAEAAANLERLLEDSEAARLEAARLNRIYDDFLRRSRSTLSVLMNVVSHCAGIYTAPRPANAYLPSPERSY